MQQLNNIALVDETAINESLKQARELVNQLELGNIEQADSIIYEFCKTRENDLFQEIGKLTRELHETLNDLGGDARLNSIMNNEMPETRHNLNHVIDLTEDATNKTLSAIEHSVPLLDGLSKRTVHLEKILQTHIKKLVEGNRLTFIEEEFEAYLDKVSVDVKSVNKDMNAILVAQGYQDISGQIIQRVSKMVQDVEHSLVGILKVNSHHINNNKQNERLKNNGAYGPVVPGVTKGEVMKNQDEVDDLLSTLGF